MELLMWAKSVYVNPPSLIGLGVAVWGFGWAGIPVWFAVMTGASYVAFRMAKP